MWKLTLSANIWDLLHNVTSRDCGRKLFWGGSCGKYDWLNTKSKKTFLRKYSIQQPSRFHTFCYMKWKNNITHLSCKLPSITLYVAVSSKEFLLTCLLCSPAGYFFVWLGHYFGLHACMPRMYGKKKKVEELGGR